MKPIKICVHPTKGYFIYHNLPGFKWYKSYNLTTSSFQRLCNIIAPTIKFQFFETGGQKWPILSGCWLILKEGINVELTKKEQYTLECLKKDGKIRHTLLSKQTLIHFNMIALNFPNNISRDDEFVYWNT